MLEEKCTHATVDTELQILGKGKTFDTRDVTNIEEPNVGQDFAFPDIAGDNTAEDVNLDLDVAGGVHPGKLGVVSNRRFPAGSVYLQERKRPRIPPWQR